MRAVADLDLCQGHQMCQAEAPTVFGFDDGADQVVLLDEHPDDSLRDAVRTAVKYCPAMALSMEEQMVSTASTTADGSRTGSLTRAEIEEFWDSWLEINREAERIGDWRIMADHYAVDATYGWMYAPDEHFMAVGRDQIRDWAIGIEMDGLDGWHYDYQATVIDERNGMVVGFWKQKSGIVDDATGGEFEILGIGGSWFGIERQDRGPGHLDTGQLKIAWQRDWFDMPSTAHTFLSIIQAGKAPETLLKRMSVTGLEVPGHYRHRDLPSSVWPPPVEAGNHVTQKEVSR